MDAVKSYVMCALLAASLAGILKNVSSGMRNFEKYVGLVCSLTVILILASPLTSVISSVHNAISSDGSLIGNIQKDPSEDERTHEIMSKQVKSTLEDTVEDILCRHFSLDNADIKVDAHLLEDKSVQKLVINVYSDTDISTIKNYVENIMCISAEVRREVRE